MRRQREADLAWAALEAHRKQVDAQRRQETPDAPGRPAWIARPMRPWTQAENEEHDKLLKAALSAQEAVRSGFIEAGIAPDFTAVHELKKAAKSPPTAG